MACKWGGANHYMWPMKCFTVDWPTHAGHMQFTARLCNSLQQPPGFTMKEVSDGAPIRQWLWNSLQQVPDSPMAVWFTKRLIHQVLIHLRGDSAQRCKQKSAQFTKCQFTKHWFTWGAIQPKGAKKQACDSPVAMWFTHISTQFTHQSTQFTY